MFGTLYVPAKEREPLVFGFDDYPDAHTVKGELVDPLINAAAHFKPQRQRELAPVPATERKQASTYLPAGWGEAYGLNWLVGGRSGSRLIWRNPHCLRAACASAPSPSTTKCRKATAMR